MIEGLIAYCVRNRFLVIVLTAAVAVAGVWAALRTPVDAIPDLSENQVIVFTDWMGRSPQEIEDQVTYPLSVNLQGLQGVKAVRSASEFNFSMISVIFEDSMDFYDARLRVLERLSLASTFLPEGVVPYLAPDATALGQVFWYTVEGEGRDLGELRAIQDWFVRYQLASVPGVAQVASVGGFPREYQVEVDPDLLRAYGVSLGELASAVARSNSAVGGRVVHKGNAEFVVRGVGWIRDLRDIEAIVVAARDGIPVTVGRVARVRMGTEFRRGVLDKGGREVTGGVVMMRFGENPLEVTRRVKAKILDLGEGLPEGVRIVPFYDRTRLVEDAVATVTGTLAQEILVASVVVILVLGHLGGALVICVTLPLAVGISFLLMKLLGIPSNIMSLSGIAISIGVLVDQSIVMTENAMHHLRRDWGDRRVTGDVSEALLPALKEVGRPLFFSVLIMIVSFLPVFSLGGMEGRMFHPLAFTKTFALVGALALTVTLLPALIPVVMKGRIRGDRESWFVRSMIAVYEPVLRWALPRPGAMAWFLAALFLVGSGFLGIPWLTAGTAFLCALAAALLRTRPARYAALAATLGLAVVAWHTKPLGREFMPPLDEGAILDMPVTVPRASVTQVADDLKARDAAIASFPEVESVVGKAGRAETPTDPSPIEMVETVVNLHPRELWPRRHVRFEDALDLSRGLVASLARAGALKPATEEDAAALANDAAMAAVGHLDAALRACARGRQRDAAPRIGRALVETVVRATVGRIRRNGLLLRPVAEAEIAAAVDALAGTWAPRLLEAPLEPDVREIARAAAGILEKSGAVKPSADLLAVREGAVARGVRDLAEALGAEPAGAFSAMREEGAGRRRALLREHTLVVDGEIERDAPAILAAAALSGALASARGRELVAREPAAEEARRIEGGAAAAFRGTLLWRKSKGEVLQDLDSALQVPGWGNIWTQPIINRVDMLATGVRTLVGVKVYGQTLDQIREVSRQVADALRAVPGAVDVFPDQITGKPTIEVAIDRARAARYGLAVEDIQDTVEVALGGRALTTTVEGRQRFPVRVRYARDYREDEEGLRRVLVAAGAAGVAEPAMGSMGTAPASTGAAQGGTGQQAAPLQVPLGEVADVKVVEGPAVIKSENGLLRAYVQLNVRGRDVVSFVEDAQRAVAEKVRFPEGSFVEWTGQFEHQVRARKTLLLVIPLVVLLNVLVLQVTYNDFADTGLIMLAVPGAVVGGILFQALFGFDFSVAVWVGYIACFGMATETGILMLVYLNESVERRGGLAKIGSLAELREAVVEGAGYRLRPKILTEGVTIIGLAPMLWATGTGAEVMRPMAAPVLGGMLMADEVVFLLLPVLYSWVRERRWKRLHPEAAA